MNFRSARLLIAAALLFAAASSAPKQQHAPSQGKTSSVRLGDHVIFIPDPEGFEEATQFERFKERLVATEAPALDTLFGHMPISDCELLRKGLAPTYNHYTKVSVLRAQRDMDITRQLMSYAVHGYRVSAGAVLDPNSPEMKSVIKQIDRELTDIDSKETKVDFSKPLQLGEFDQRPDVNSFLLLITVKINSGGTVATLPMLTSASFVRVNERLIYVYVYKRYQTEADYEAVKQFTRQWTTSIVAANSKH